MGFTDDVKNVWTTGYQLFHSKFIRFMGGYKNKGFLRQSQDKRNTLFQSTINFVCPDIKRLRDNKAKIEINCSEPGLIVSSIGSLVGKEGVQQKGYKICLDGNKLTIGFGKKLGEVHLYGHETAPNPPERTIILREEEQIVKNAQELLNKAEELGHTFLQNLYENKMNECYKNDLIQIFTQRQKQLRERRVKRTSP